MQNSLTFFVMILYVLILRYQMKSYFTYESIVSLDEANELKDKTENFKITDAINFVINMLAM